MISPAAREALVAAFADRVQFSVPMSRHTSLRVGGPVDALVAPESPRDVATLLQICRAHGLPHFVIGAGFNSIVRDGGLPGVAVQMSRLRRVEERPGGLLRAEAGVSHGSITRFCAERGLAGLEFAVGIPGTVGGWIAMNAGIGEREMVDVVHEIEVVSPGGRKRSHLPAARLHFRYRALRGLARGSVMVSALLRVTPDDPAAIRARMRALLTRRAGSQPLDLPSCGSVFKNPPGQYAGQLLEAAGLKGVREGGAQISLLHANFITNTGGASAHDVLTLIERARRAVKKRQGVLLETEVRIEGVEAGAETAPEARLEGGEAQ